MKKVFFLLVAAAAMFTVSCNKSEQTDSGPVERAIDMRVPSGFLYENSKDIQFKITVSDDSFGPLAHRITFYDGDPFEGGTIVAVGAGSVSRPFIGKLDLEILTKELFVAKKSPSGDVSVKKATVSGNTLEMDFANLKDEKIAVRNTSPTCTGCNQSFTGSNQNVQVNNGITCITGAFSGNITINGNAEVRICGTANIQNFTMNGNNGRLTITNSGIATFSGGLGTNSVVINFGTANFNQAFNIHSNGRFENEGTINVGQSMDINGSTASVNNGQLNISGAFNVNTSGVFVNNCSLTANQVSALNGKVDNHGYMKFNQLLRVQGNASNRLDLHNAAMVSAQSIEINKPIRGNGSKSLIKIAQTTTINSSGALQGNLQLCDANGVETNNGQTASTVDFECDVYIPTGSCNPEGNGTAAVDDGDGDNVPDPIDDFPDDPNAAFSTFYPSETGMNTLVFEDLWPGLGDYDMNDMVIDYRYSLVVNAENGVTKIQATYKLRAAGAASPAGFGVELPFLRSNVASVTGATLETGHTNAVIILFENSKDHLKSFNTLLGTSSGDPVLFTVDINLTNPIPLNQLGLGVYNPFIWITNSPSGRGHEIHLPGRQPTAKADVSLFGTVNDDSNPSAGKFYLSDNNLPWALNIPGEFSYPIEKADICITYLNFAPWAESGGSVHQDWYLVIPGNVNMTKLYQ
jgi:LruC domain-containing protein